MGDEGVPSVKQLSLSPSKQEKILAHCHPRIRNSLDIQAILPHLNQQDLLTSDERDILLQNSHSTRCNKIDHLLQWLPRKGEDALERFIQCLRSSSEGTGHRELATLLAEEAARQATPKPTFNRKLRGK